jgi:hypothetical protein
MVQGRRTKPAGPSIKIRDEKVLSFCMGHLLTILLKKLRDREGGPVHY